MRTWADISREALAANLDLLRAALPRGGRLLLPVKADAYGHGAVAVARWAEELDVGWLGVACREEALELRESGVVARILLFGPLPAEGVDDLRPAGVTPTLCSLAEAERWARTAPGTPAHVEVDTGMGRSGFDWRRAAELARLRDVAGLALEGAYTHFAAAESDAPFTREQHDRFRAVIGALEALGTRFPLVHLSNSAGLLLHGRMDAHLARAGIAAYAPSAAYGAERSGTAAWRPLLTWWARVVQVRDLEPGDSVGYGRDARIERPTRAALLAVGYGDGYPRSQAAGGFVELRGARCPVLGRISMDLTTVDVTAVPDVRVGDAALLLGERPGLSADALAGRSNTISYEILTGLARRVERRHLLGEPEAEPGTRQAGNPPPRDW
ncbi:MAG: alanine racemase [Gemmatimonadota bacterium]